LGHALSIGDEFQQDFRAIGDASSSDNGSSTPSFYSVDFHEVSNKLFNDLEDRLKAHTNHTQMYFFVFSSYCRLYMMVVTRSKHFPNALLKPESL
jgi:hypothetical protein